MLPSEMLNIILFSDGDRIYLCNNAALAGYVGKLKKLKNGIAVVFPTLISPPPHFPHTHWGQTIFNFIVFFRKFQKYKWEAPFLMVGVPSCEKSCPLPTNTYTQCEQVYQMLDAIHQVIIWHFTKKFKNPLW